MTKNQPKHTKTVEEDTVDSMDANKHRDASAGLASIKRKRRAPRRWTKKEKNKKKKNVFIRSRARINLWTWSNQGKVAFQRWDIHFFFLFNSFFFPGPLWQIDTQRYKEFLVILKKKRWSENNIVHTLLSNENQRVYITVHFDFHGNKERGKISVSLASWSWFVGARAFDCISTVWPIDHGRFFSPFLTSIEIHQQRDLKEEKPKKNQKTKEGKKKMNSVENQRD